MLSFKWNVSGEMPTSLLIYSLSINFLLQAVRLLLGPLFFSFGATAARWQFTRFLDHTRRTTVGRIPLGGW